jgi:hypothetical protein
MVDVNIRGKLPFMLYPFNPFDRNCLLLPISSSQSKIILLYQSDGCCLRSVPYSLFSSLIFAACKARRNEARTACASRERIDFDLLERVMWIVDDVELIDSEDTYLFYFLCTAYPIDGFTLEYTH